MDLHKFPCETVPEAGTIRGIRTSCPTRKKEAAVSFSCRFSVLAAVSFLVGFPANAALNAPPTPEQINQWVEQLGDTDFAKRQEASKRLWEAGQPAEKPLQAAVKGDDAEVRRRAKDILDKFKWGLYPDTPTTIVELVKQYQGADTAAKPASTTSSKSCSTSA
jgi:hypothetical protein